MSAKAWFGRLALIVTGLAAAGPAQADPAPAPAPAPAVQDPGETSQYRAMLEEAVSEYDAHRYEEARALFRRAHEISPNARTQIEALIERTRAFVGRFFLKLSPKETIVRVDGAPAVVEGDGSLLLSFGRHTLAAESPGSTSESREINVIGGERQELAFQLRPEVAPVVPVKGPGGGAAGGGEASASSGAAYWFAGAGVLAAGAVGGFLWSAHEGTELNKCKEANATPGSGCDNSGPISTNKRVSLGVAVGSGVAALAMGIVGTIVWSTNSKPESGTALACLPTPGAVNCELELHF